MNKRIASLYNTLQESGHRLTRARREILSALVRSGGHISADELAELVHRKAPGIGRMTVYRTLDLLHELGLVRPIYQGTGAAHYILMDRGHHHHLICSACDQVVELEECVVQQAEQAIHTRFNFEIQGHLLEFYGLCPDCRQE